MIASLYIGLFGSYFGTNIIRVLLNSLLAERIYKNPKSLLKYIISSESVRVVEEIAFVRLAEKNLIRQRTYMIEKEQFDSV